MASKRSSVLTEQAQLSADPSSPVAGYSVIFPKSDGKWYAKNSDGTVTEVTSSIIPKQTLGISLGNSTYAAATLVYQSLLGSSSGASNSVETTKQLAWILPGTFNALYVYMHSAQPSTGSITFTLRKGGAATALKVIVPLSGAAGLYTDLTNSVTNLAGDQMSLEINNAASGTSGGVRGFTLVHTPT